MSLKSSNVIIIPITMFSTVNIFDEVDSKFINHILKIYIQTCHQSINQSINQSYLFIDYIKTFLSECDSNNWGTSCAQICLCDMAKTSDCNNVDGNCTCKTGWRNISAISWQPVLVVKEAGVHRENH
jgi:hypothetical protein